MSVTSYAKPFERALASQQTLLQDVWVLPSHKVAPQGRGERHLFTLLVFLISPIPTFAVELRLCGWFPFVRGRVELAMQCIYASGQVPFQLTAQEDSN